MTRLFSHCSDAIDMINGQVSTVHKLSLLIDELSFDAVELTTHSQRMLQRFGGFVRVLLLIVSLHKYSQLSTLNRVLQHECTLVAAMLIRSVTTCGVSLSSANVRCTDFIDSSAHSVLP